MKITVVPPSPLSLSHTVQFTLQSSIVLEIDIEWWNGEGKGWLFLISAAVVGSKSAHFETCRYYDDTMERVKSYLDLVITPNELIEIKRYIQEKKAAGTPTTSARSSYYGE